MTNMLPQQAPFGALGPPTRQPSPQHGQKAAETQVPTIPSRSFNPRPGH